MRPKAEQTYGAEVAGILPLEEEVVRLASSAVFCMRNPEHAWTREVERVAARVMA